MEAEVGVAQVAAGGLHAALLCSDGRVLTCGDTISAGGFRTVLLRSDGRIVACGCD